MKQLINVLMLFGAIFSIAYLATASLCDIVDNAKYTKSGKSKRGGL